jgi:hypothetical protein
MKALLLAASLFFTLPAIAADDDPPVKKSSTGICHAKGSTYYAKTKNFTPYHSVDECLKSGGRLPKR